MRSSRRLALAALPLALLAACGGGDEAAPTTVPETTAAETTTSEATTTTVEETTTTLPAPEVYPLTGLPYTDPVAAALPAVIVKVGNYDAHPQWNMAAADIVYEEIINDQVSRFAVVYHTNAPDMVGPVRSGRLQDVDLFGLFNRPIFAWAGGNGTVMAEIGNSDLIDLSQFVCQGTCFRSEVDNAPYNLFFDVTKVRELDLPDAGTPPAQYTWRAEGESPAGVPNTGIDVQMDSYEVEWIWNAATSQYERLQNAKPDKDEDGTQVAFDNVVVLEMIYDPGISGSPDARSVGAGEAWVLTGGNLVHGTWSRDDRLDPFTLLDDDGEVIALTPGRTFVMLPRDGDNVVPKS
jgi:hypothetical protein